MESEEWTWWSGTQGMIDRKIEEINDRKEEKKKKRGERKKKGRKGWDGLCPSPAWTDWLGHVQTKWVGIVVFPFLFDWFLLFIFRFPFWLDSVFTTSRVLTCWWLTPLPSIIYLAIYLFTILFPTKATLFNSILWILHISPPIDRFNLIDHEDHIVIPGSPPSETNDTAAVEIWSARGVLFLCLPVLLIGCVGVQPWANRPSLPAPSRYWLTGPVPIRYGLSPIFYLSIFLSFYGFRSKMSCD